VRRGWRLIVGLLIVAVVVTAQFARGNDWFPLGTLGQYAYPRDPDGAVVNTYLTATTTDGAEVRIGLTARSAGVTRAEVEVQMADLQDDPAMLADIAAVWEGNHPGEQLETMTVRQTVHRMSDGAVVGAPEEKVVLAWDVP
jgi:hypothetical protein